MLLNFIDKVYGHYTKNDMSVMFIIHLLRLNTPLMFNMATKDFVVFLENCFATDQDPSLAQVIFNHAPQIIVRIDNIMEWPYNNMSTVGGIALITESFSSDCLQSNPNCESALHVHVCTLCMYMSVSVSVSVSMCVCVCVCTCICVYSSIILI